MELTPRQKQILRAIVDIYVSTAEPVGSKAIAALPDVSFSSATIRNEMAELTQMGLLEQPHTSAGRIPSPAGYRFYIDELMQDYRLSIDETKSLNEALELKSQEFDEMMSQVGKLVSKMTNLPAYAMASRQGQAVVKHFELVQAGPGSIILVLMLSGDEVKNKLIRLPVKVTDADLKLLSAILNTSLTDLSGDAITVELLEKVTRSAGAAAPRTHRSAGGAKIGSVLVPVLLENLQERNTCPPFCRRTDRFISWSARKTSPRSSRTPPSL